MEPSEPFRPQSYDMLNLPVSLWRPMTIHAWKALTVPPSLPPSMQPLAPTIIIKNITSNVVESAIIQIITSTSEKFASFSWRGDTYTTFARFFLFLYLLSLVTDNNQLT